MYAYRFEMSSHALQELKSQSNKNSMQNVHVVSRPKFYVLSNDALVLAASLILCTGKWRKLFTETVLAFNLHFQQLGINLQKIQLCHSKERGILV